MICNNCYYQGKPKMKGSLLIAILLLIIFFPAAIVYAVVMSSGNTNVCPKCKTSGMIPEDSPKAIEILKKLEEKGK